MPAKIFNLSDYPKHLQDLCKHPEPDHLPSDPREWIDYRTLFSVTEADIPLLWEIASFIDKMDDSNGELYYAPSHAWMALGQFDESSVNLAKILDALNLIYWPTVEYGLIAIRDVVVRLGTDDVTQLIKAFQDEKRHDKTRTLILDALVIIQKNHPEYRESVVQMMMDELSKMAIGFRSLYGHIVYHLGEENIRDALPLIETAYSQGLVEPDYSGFLENIQKQLGVEPVSNPDIDRLETELEAISIIVYKFRRAETVFPKQAVLDARKYRDLIIPLLIEEVRNATAYSRFGIITDGVIQFAVHLLAEFQAKESLPFVLESLSLTEDQEWDLYIDSLYESMPGILYRLMGNDVSDYDRMLRNPETPVVLRAIVLSALPYLIKYENLSRDKHASLLHDYLRLGIDEANEKFVTGVVCALPDGDTSFLPLAKEAFEKDLVDPEMVDWPFVESHLLDRKPNYDSVLRCVRSDFSDTVATLGKWGWFTEPKPKTAIPPLSSRLSSFGFDDILPQQQKEHKVGRNDRCPCGRDDGQRLGE